MNINVPGQRTQIALKWSGKDPIKLPKATIEHEQFTLKPGINEGVPLAYWRALGNYPEIVELIAAGDIAAVCTAHVFPDPRDVEPNVAHVGGHCRYCGHSRVSAAAAEAAARAALSGGGGSGTGAVIIDTNKGA